MILRLLELIFNFLPYFSIMAIYLPEKGAHYPDDKNLEIISQIFSDDLKDGKPISYIEVYEKKFDPNGSPVSNHDKWRVVWKNDETLEVHDYDKRDLIDTISILSQALSVIENRISSCKYTANELNSINKML